MDPVVMDPDIGPVMGPVTRISVKLDCIMLATASLDPPPPPPPPLPQIGPEEAPDGAPEGGAQEGRALDLTVGIISFIFLPESIKPLFLPSKQSDRHLFAHVLARIAQYNDINTT